MRIYTKLVIGLQGEVLEEQSFEYEGPVAECKGTPPPVQFPGPTEEEQELQKVQTELLNIQTQLLTEQHEFQEMLQPILLQSAGIQAIRDDAGEIIGFEERKTEEQQQLEQLQKASLENLLQLTETQLGSPEIREKRAEVENLLLERSRAALAGELPVNPALLTQLEEEESQLTETLRKQLGPGFETSTPGQEALDRFGRRKSDILEAARRGDITLAESLSLAREGAGFGAAQTFGDLAGFGGAGAQGFQSRAAAATAFPFALQGSFGDVAAGINPALNRGLAVRQAQFGADVNRQLLSAQMGNQRFGAIVGGISNIAGTAAGVGLSRLAFQ